MDKLHSLPGIMRKLTSFFHRHFSPITTTWVFFGFGSCNCLHLNIATETCKKIVLHMYKCNTAINLSHYSKTIREAWQAVLPTGCMSFICSLHTQMEKTVHRNIKAMQNLTAVLLPGMHRSDQLFSQPPGHFHQVSGHEGLQLLHLSSFEAHLPVNKELLKNLKQTNTPQHPRLKDAADLRNILSKKGNPLKKASLCSSILCKMSLLSLT